MCNRVRSSKEGTKQLTVSFTANYACLSPLVRDELHSVPIESDVTTGVVDCEIPDSTRGRISFSTDET